MLIGLECKKPLKNRGWFSLPTCGKQQGVRFGGLCRFQRKSSQSIKSFDEKNPKNFCLVVTRLELRRDGPAPGYRAARVGPFF